MQDFTKRQLSAPINTLAIPTLSNLEKFIEVRSRIKYPDAKPSELLKVKVTHWGRERYAISIYNATRNLSHLLHHCDATKSIAYYLNHFSYIIS